MKSLFNLEGKLAIVTGGSNGLLGPIWAETIIEAGGDVVSWDLPKVDVSKEIDIENALNETISLYGVPDILINNAAIDNPPTSKASFFGNFERIMDVNISGAVRCCKYVLPKMVENGGGIIVNIGSIQGFGGADYRNYEGDFEKPFGYNASKWALRGLSKSLTVQYGRKGIRSVTICFGPYDGGKLKPEFLEKFLKNVPLARCISKESCQRTLLYALCCEEFAGQDVRVDAGLGAWA